MTGESQGRGGAKESDRGGGSWAQRKRTEAGAHGRKESERRRRRGGAKKANGGGGAGAYLQVSESSRPE